MHVATVPTRQNGRIYNTVLVRQSYREGAKVKHRTLANLTKLPPAAIEAVRAILKGESVGPLGQDFEIERSLPHGHVLAVLGELRQLGVEKLLAPRRRRERDLAVAMIVSRVLHPDSKVATAKGFGTTSLGGLLGVEGANEDELYGAMDWLLGSQEKVEEALARKHLASGGMVLYDLTSVHMEGRHCELSRHGYSRDGRKGSLQVEFGLIADREGRPVAVDVFEGNVADPMTVEAQVRKIRERFGISDVVWVGDRGMLTSARIETLRAAGGMKWISALRSEQIRALVSGGHLQLGLFDERNLAEIVSPSFPGERLVICRNPWLAEERSRKREALLVATESELEKVSAQVASGRLRAAGAIGERVGRVIDRYKMAKHFWREIEEGSLRYGREQEKIESEAALDGIYAIRSNVPEGKLSTAELVRSYKSLSGVERAFRSLKSVDLQVRPVYHRLADRVRTHIFLCMLAYYVRWHLERAWAPLLYRDEMKPVPADPVAPAQRSPHAEAKVHRGRREDGRVVYSFRGLLRQLQTLTKNTVRVQGTEAAFEKLATPTLLQTEALELLGLTPSLS